MSAVNNVILVIQLLFQAIPTRCMGNTNQILVKKSASPPGEIE